MMMVDKINYFDVVTSVEPDPDGQFAAVGSVERTRIVLEIAKVMREKAALDRLGEIRAKSKDPEVIEKIDALSAEDRAKLNYLISEGVVFDEYS